MAVSGLSCSKWDLRCGMWDLFVVVVRFLSWYCMWAPKCAGSVVVGCVGGAYLPHCTWDISSPNRDWTWVLCIERQILNHWITGEVPIVFYLFIYLTFVEVSLVYSILCLIYAIVYFEFGIYYSILTTRIRVYIHHHTVDLFSNFALPPPLFLW